MKTEINTQFKKLQDQICLGLEKINASSKFSEDLWERPGGGGGRSRILSEGKVIQKGGVNFSEVSGPTPEAILKSLDLPPSDFYATGVSIVIHPVNPWVPIIHMNVRYFEMSDGTYWFGGGIDLTPHYVIDSDAVFFHKQLKEICDQHDSGYYAQFKKWADDYFFIKHRNETRGIGGIFFDRLSSQEAYEKEQLWQFVLSLGSGFLPIYTELISRNRDRPFTKAQQDWQYLRRGRYVEFNLVLDKGTKFGLDTDGRTESILMSLPPFASWEYNHQPEKESPEAKTLAYLVKDIDWINND
jgi:coproporphyrinogen III oxidase